LMMAKAMGEDVDDKAIDDLLQLSVLQCVLESILRDALKREVDFLIVWDKNPWMLVECKLSGGNSLEPLRRFGDALDVKERYLVTLDSGRDYLDRETGVRVVPAAKFLPGLGV
jgi:hypothetical protein